MRLRGRGIRYAAVSVLMVLSLTGFSTGRGHGSGSGGGGGGGCSSSQQDHDSSSSTSGSTSGGSSDDYGDYGDGDYDYGNGDYDDGDYGNGDYGDSATDDPYGDSGPAGDRLKPATVKLLKCATVKEPYATVEVTNPNAVETAFWVAVSFRDGQDATIKDETWRIDVPADDKLTVDIEMSRKSKASSVDHCEVEPKAEVATD
ncbi:hypothetical protein [Streptomyces deserti]